MKTAEERNELFAAGGVHRQLQGSLNSFGAAVGEMCAGRSLNGDYFVELLRQFRHSRVVVVGAAHVNQLRRLVLDCARTTSGWQ